jgi:catechol 2,3-dioxygenase-like lactoylglutathione lyase family enzyme
LFFDSKKVVTLAKTNAIGEIMEIIIYVDDMNGQVSFYRDKLGFKVKTPHESTDYSNEFWVELDTGSCSLALHAGGKRRFGTDAPKFVFRVSDILAARQSLIDQEVEMGEIRSAAPGIWVCDGVDPEGNKFSIESHE